MAGLIAYGAHVPYHRLARADVAAALGTPAAKGTRAVAGYDEDTTSMAVEAARTALARGDLRPRIGQLFLATARPGPGGRPDDGGRGERARHPHHQGLRPAPQP
ncbi:hypothetical protein ABZ372_55755, partial [Streptomyces sp. NPDC005921]